MDAVVAGHICLDLTPGFGTGAGKVVGEILAPGKLTEISGMSVATGGAVANTGRALSLLGIDTQLMGKLGDDYFGGIVQQILKENKVGNAMTVFKGARTSYTVILAPPGTDRILLHDPGANDTFCFGDVNFDVVGKARLFHFGYPPAMKRMFQDGGRELIAIFKQAKSLGLTTSLDMSVPDPHSDAGRVDWAGMLAELLPYVDVYVPSIEETLFMLAPDEFRRLEDLRGSGDFIQVLDLNYLPQLGDNILAMGAKVVMLKCGKKGIYLRTAGAGELATMGKAAPADPAAWANRELIEEPFIVPKVLSTTGAGDTSIAAFLASLLKGYSLEEGAKIACATGSECVQAYDALSGVLPLPETRRRIAAGWAKERIGIGGAYWRYDGKGAVWYGRQDRQPSSS